MRATIEVSFPCSEAEWEKVLTIRSLVGSAAAVQVEQRSCGAVAKPMPAIPQVDTLSDSEEKVLRAMNESKSSDTPMLDLMAKHGAR